jgi:hypothetical protein
VKPGEVGLAFIFFDGTAKLPPADAEYVHPAHASGLPAARGSW